jgi:23S rRNA pseudouridine1911/1915/1917 synthase
MLDIAYEDEFLLAAVKPPGIHTAPLSFSPSPSLSLPPSASSPGGKSEGQSLLEEVLSSYPGIGRIPGRKPCEPGLLHRLDRDTSGLVLFAKTEAAFDFLLGLQREGLFIKGYRALCEPCGLPLAGARPPRGEIEGGLILSRFRAFGPKAARVAPIGLSLEAEGPVYRTRILSRHDEGGRASLELELSRGFRHQLRAQLAWVGLPILGDPLYAPPREGSDPGAARLMLHASRLEFPHPRGDGSRLSIESPADVSFLLPAGAV